MLDLSFKFDRRAFTSKVQSVEKSIRFGRAEPIKAGLRQAAARYLGFIRRRFDNAGKGDGTWKPLSLSTMLARLRKRKGSAQKLRSALRKVDKKGGLHGAKRLESAVALTGASFTILRDTSTLFNSLTTGAPGSTQRESPNHISVGTAVFYAKYHQKGSVMRRLPQRTILVQPDQATAAAMREDIARGMRLAIEQGEKAAG